VRDGGPQGQGRDGGWRGTGHLRAWLEVAPARAQPQLRSSARPRTARRAPSVRKSGQPPDSSYVRRLLPKLARLPASRTRLTPQATPRSRNRACGRWLPLHVSTGQLAHTSTATTDSYLAKIAPTERITAVREAGVESLVEGVRKWGAVRRGATTRRRLRFTVREHSTRRTALPRPTRRAVFRPPGDERCDRRSAQCREVQGSHRSERRRSRLRLWSRVSFLSSSRPRQKSVSSQSGGPEAASERGIRVVVPGADIEDGTADVVVSNHALEHTLRPVDENRCESSCLQRPVIELPQ
jgi:hypothetical protein